MSVRPSHSHLRRMRLETLLRWLAFDGAARDCVAPADGRTDWDWPALIAAGITTGLLGALAAKLADDAPALTMGADVDRQLVPILAGLRYRRESQKARLEALCEAWNTAGIEPLLFDSARSVWIGASWDYAEELGVLVPRGSMEAARKVLKDLGYQRVPSLDRSRYRQETSWCHPRVNGVVVLREIGTHRRIERQLPATDLLASSNHITVGRATARVMHPAYDVLHAVLLHHRPPLFGWGTATVSPKVLFRFARMVHDFTDDDLSQFWRLADRHRELKAIVTRWLDAADRCFKLGLDYGSRPSAQHARSRQDGRDTPPVDLIETPAGHRIVLNRPAP